MDTAPMGLIAEFDSAECLLHAARRVHAVGYRALDAYTPFHVEGLAEALASPRKRLPFVALVGGLLGGLAGFLIQYYSWVIDYPLNVGGRPHFAWPAFILVTFEMTVLGAALAAVIAMLAMSGLPRLHHPVFGAPRFEDASQDRFLLWIDARDPKFDRSQSRHFLENLGPLSVSELWT